MSLPVLTYAPSDVTIVISGYTVGGILSIELEWKARPFTYQRGIRNVHTRVFNKDLSAVLRLQVLQTSITNDVLSQVLIQDRLNKSARLDVTVKDTGGTTLYQANQCYVSAFPPIKLSQGFETRTWEIDVFDFVTLNVGGNSRAGFDVFSSVQGAMDLLGNTASDIGTAIDDFLIPA